MRISREFKSFSLASPALQTIHTHVYVYKYIFSKQFDKQNAAFFNVKKKKQRKKTKRKFNT